MNVKNIVIDIKHKNYQRKFSFLRNVASQKYENNDLISNRIKLKTF